MLITTNLAQRTEPHTPPSSKCIILYIPHACTARPDIGHLYAKPFHSVLLLTTEGLAIRMSNRLTNQYSANPAREARVTTVGFWNEA